MNMLPQIVKLIDRYSEPHRYYHTFKHIGRLFELAAKHSLYLTTTQKIALAYHDAVYIPGRLDNEQKSVDAMLEDMNVHPSVIDIPELSGGHGFDPVLAAKIIMDTKTHIPSCPESETVLDLDLADLGSDWDNYRRNSINIALEYTPIMNATKWVAARKSWIESFLERPVIFHTNWGRTHFEAKARANLNQELTNFKKAIRKPSYEDL